MRLRHPLRSLLCSIWRSVGRAIPAYNGGVAAIGRRVTKAETSANPAPEPDSLPVTPEQLAHVVVASPWKTDWAYEQASG